MTIKQVSLYIIKQVFAIFVLVVILGLGSVRALTQNNTSIGLNITNSYTGYLQFASGQTSSRYYDGNDYRTNTTGISIDIGASHTSSYIISGDFVGGLITGSGVGVYSSTLPLQLTASGGLHRIAINYLRDREPNTPDPLTIYLDQQAPTKSDLLVPNNTIITDDIIELLWSASTDTGVGLRHYTLFIGLTPSLSSMVAVNTLGTSIKFNKNDLPQGTIYWTVLATDLLGNQSDYYIGYFHHNQQTYIPILGGGVSTTPIDQYNPSSQNGSDFVNNGNSPIYELLYSDIPVYTQDDNNTTYTHSVAAIRTCTGLRIQSLRNCIAWDTNISNPIHATNNNILLTNNRDTDSVITSTDDIIAGQDQGRVITNIATPLQFIPLAQALYTRYFANPPKGWILPKTGVDNNRSLTSSDSYELIIKQYGENIALRTREFSWYIILIGTSMIGLTRWFFMGGYHHRYRIKYFVDKEN